MCSVIIRQALKWYDLEQVPFFEHRFRGCTVLELVPFPFHRRRF